MEREREKEIYYKKLVLTVMEAEKSQDPLANWRPRRANVIVSIQGRGLRTKRADGVSFNLSPKAGEDRCPSSKADRVNSPLLQHFVLFRLSMNWIRLTHTREGNLLYSNVNPIQKTPSQTHPE